MNNPSAALSGLRDMGHPYPQSTPRHSRGRARVLLAMRRIVILGCSGAGKSTLARTLGQRLHIPVFHLDAILWKPGWVMSSREDEIAAQRRIVAGESWIIDGNYAASLDVRLPRADTLIYLDYPRWKCLWRALARWLRHRGRQRPDMGARCPEKFDWEFLCWIWNFRRDVRPGVLEKIRAWRDRATVVILRSDAEVQAFLDMREPATGAI